MTHLECDTSTKNYERQHEPIYYTTFSPIVFNVSSLFQAWKLLAGRFGRVCFPTFRLTSNSVPTIRKLAVNCLPARSISNGNLVQSLRL